MNSLLGSSLMVEQTMLNIFLARNNTQYKLLHTKIFFVELVNMSHNFYQVILGVKVEIKDGTIVRILPSMVIKKTISV